MSQFLIAIAIRNCDMVTRLYYLRNRYYDPRLGRFTQQDPYWGPANAVYGHNDRSAGPNYMAVVQSNSLYVYCANSPLVYHDPWGLAAGYRMVNGNNVRLRKKPYTDSTIYATLSRGTLVYYYDIKSTGGSYERNGKTYSDWANVSYNGQYGWIAAQYLSFPDDASRRTIDTSLGTPSSSSKERTAMFAVGHALEALAIGEFKSGSTNITTNAVRFSTGLRLDENDAREGSQVNAFRHALWQATITKRYGAEIAKWSGDAHEDNPYAQNNIYDMSISAFATLSIADEVCDLKNNIEGRIIGGKATSNAMNEIAKDVLEHYRSPGLWVASRMGDGRYKVYQEKLATDKYNYAKSVLECMDKNGYC